MKAAPEIVSSARIEITANVFMPQSSFSIVAKNVRAWRIFGTNKRCYRGRWGGRLFDHLVRPRDKRRRQVEAERLGGLQIDDEQELVG